MAHVTGKGTEATQKAVDAYLARSWRVLINKCATELFGLHSKRYVTLYLACWSLRSSPCKLSSLGVVLIIYLRSPPCSELGCLEQCGCRSTPSPPAPKPRRAASAYLWPLAHFRDVRYAKVSSFLEKQMLFPHICASNRR